ncbi:hypothetical protein F5X99DRAFT_294893 [Biscogniauxia marginata]|nr:hypothetical protein F5X99DRAFT_294893 [Biscogniauxia marginata]
MFHIFSFSIHSRHVPCVDNCFYFSLFFMLLLKAGACFLQLSNCSNAPPASLVPPTVFKPTFTEGRRRRLI